MAAVFNLMNTHRDALSLSTDIDCVNCLGVNDVISYFEHNPLKYCMLVADADKFKAMTEQQKGVNPRLLQTADKKVGKFFFSNPSGPNIPTWLWRTSIGSKQ